MRSIFTRAREIYDWAERFHFLGVIREAIQHYFGIQLGAGLVAMIGAAALGAPWWGTLLAGLLAFLVALAGYIACVLYRHRSKLQLSLVPDTDGTIGMQKFGPQFGYYEGWIQVAVQADPRAEIRECRAVISRIDFSWDGQKFDQEHNEKIMRRWSREKDPDVATFDDPNEKRINIAVFKELPRQLVLIENDPLNVVPLLSRAGIHRFKIEISGKRKKHIIAETAYLFIDLSPKRGDPRITLEWPVKT
jgi:hypothetical protein